MILQGLASEHHPYLRGSCTWERSGLPFGSVAEAKCGFPHSRKLQGKPWPAAWSILRRQGAHSMGASPGTPERRGKVRNRYGMPRYPVSVRETSNPSLPVPEGLGSRGHQPPRGVVSGEGKVPRWSFSISACQMIRSLFTPWNLCWLDSNLRLVMASKQRVRLAVAHSPRKLVACSE